MIVYLTHWFRLRERSRAVACLYAAVPAGSLIGSPLAGWLLGVHWWLLAGWRWLFILEGIPAIALGIVTVFYLTDWPAQAGWLPQDERDWLVNELQAELQVKNKIRNYTITEAFCDRRILRLIVAWFLALTGSLGTIYWIPTFVKRLSGFPTQTVTSLLLIPALIGIAGNAHQRLALRSHGRAALAQCYSASRRRIDVRALDRLPPRSPVGDCMFASG
jgi:ACS family tartrate transporter-like MFS transporter